MKKTINLNILFLILLSSNFYAQNNVTETDLKSVVSKIFNLCSEKNYGEMANILLFSDKNELRPFNYANKSEAKVVKRKCKKIKAYLDLSDSYEFDGFVNQEKNNIHYATITIGFISGDQKLKISFNFVKLNGKLLLKDFK